MCISVYCTSTYSVLHGIVPRTLVHKGAALPLTEPWEIFPGNKCLAPAMRLRVFPSYPTQPSDENPDARPLSARDRRDKREIGLVTRRRVLFVLYVRFVLYVFRMYAVLVMYLPTDIYPYIVALGRVDCNALLLLRFCLLLLLAGCTALCIVHLDSFRRAETPRLCR
jgi:hypothetical protein